MQLLSGSRQRREVILKHLKCAEMIVWAAVRDGLRGALEGQADFCGLHHCRGTLSVWGSGGSAWRSQCHCSLPGPWSRTGQVAPCTPEGPFAGPRGHLAPATSFSNPKPPGGAPRVEMKQPEDPINSGGGGPLHCDQPPRGLCFLMCKWGAGEMNADSENVTAEKGPS